MEEERLMILKMVEEGKITSEEAAALLEALDAHSEWVVVTPGDGLGKAEESERANRSEEGDSAERAESFAGQCSRNDEDGFDEIGRRAEHFSERVSKAAEELGERLGKLGEELGERVPNFVFSGLEDIFFLAPTHRFEEQMDGRFEDGPVEILLRGANGNVSVSGWDSDGYRLELVETVRGRHEEEARRRIGEALTIERGARRLQLEAGAEYGLNVRVKLWLPRGIRYRMTVKSANGNIALANLEVDAGRLSTANGRIQIDSVSGDSLEVVSTNGRIEGALSVGDVSAKTTNGRIALTLRGRPGRRCYAKTTNGRIDLSVPRDWPCVLDGANNFGSLQVEMGGLTYHENLSSVGHRKVRASRPGTGNPTELLLRSTNGSIRVGDLEMEGEDQ